MISSSFIVNIICVRWIPIPVNVDTENSQGTFAKQTNSYLTSGGVTSNNISCFFEKGHWGINSQPEIRMQCSTMWRKGAERGHTSVAFLFSPFAWGFWQSIAVSIAHNQTKMAAWLQGPGCWKMLETNFETIMPKCLKPPSNSKPGDDGSCTWMPKWRLQRQSPSHTSLVLDTRKASEAKVWHMAEGKANSHQIERISNKIWLKEYE